MHGAHRSAEARMNAEHHFRQSECESIVLDGDAPTAGEREFESTAQGIAVYRGDRGAGQALEACQHALAALDQRLGLGDARERGEFLDVGTGDEAVFFGRQNHEAARRDALDHCELPVEFIEHLARQRVRGGARFVEREPGDPLRIDRQTKTRRSTHRNTSKSHTMGRWSDSRTSGTLKSLTLMRESTSTKSSS